MKNTDMVIWQAKDEGICKDLYSKGYNTPSFTETQDYTTTVKKEGDNY